MDEATGLYYYGARYYDPRASVWISTDPLQEKYPNISTYAYVFQNPLKYIDPTGMEAGDPPLGINPSDIEGAYWNRYVQNNAADIVKSRIKNEVKSVTHSVRSNIKQKILDALPPAVKRQFAAILANMEQNIKNFDYAQVGIGVEKRIGFETSSGVKGESAGVYGNVVFLGGDDGGYVYSYYGGDVGFGAESSVGANVNVAKSYFIAYNITQTNIHKSFFGDYSYGTLGGGVSTGSITGGVDLGIGASIGVSISTDWIAVSSSVNGSLGAGVSTVVTGSSSGGVGKTIPIENVGAKGLFQTIFSYRKLFTPF